jgi:uncharacterized protein
VTITDGHFHLGSCRVFDADVSEDDALAAMDANGVDRMIIQPYPGAPDPAAVHDRIAAMARDSDRIFGLASLSPHMDPADYHAEVSRCVKDLGFVGVKLHTIGHAVNPRSRDAEAVFDSARQLGVSVMVHTGPGVPFADPAQVASRARQFSDVTIVLAHAGAGIFSGSAIAIAETFDNVVLETSWCRSTDIGQMVGLLGSDRVMLGTDHPRNVAPELMKYRSLGLRQEQLDDVLGRTAERVYRLPS